MYGMYDVFARFISKQKLINEIKFFLINDNKEDFNNF